MKGLPMRTYWQKQVLKHRRMAATFRAKFERTGEVRWLRQARSNDRSANQIAAKWGEPA